MFTPGSLNKSGDHARRSSKAAWVLLGLRSDEKVNDSRVLHPAELSRLGAVCASHTRHLSWGLLEVIQDERVGTSAKQGVHNPMLVFLGGEVQRACELLEIETGVTVPVGPVRVSV